MSVTFIEDGPNESAISYRIDGRSFMGGLGAVVLSHNSRGLDQISPLVNSLFSNIRDLANLTMVAKPDGDLITLTGPANKWADDLTALMESERILKEEISAGRPLLNEAAVRENLDVLPVYNAETAASPYEPDSPPDRLFRKLVGLTKTTFDKAVTPVLETDGGAIEIEGLEVDFGTGEITPRAVLVAQCFGCDGQEGTLKNAFEALGLALEGIKQGNSADVIQKLYYRPIIARDAPMGYALEKNS